MHNGLITRAPITLFLGAGASSPLGKPLMGSFVDRLRTNSELANSELFQRIVAQENDLEHLLGELGSWSDKGYFTSELPSRGPLGRIILSDRQQDEFRNRLSSVIVGAEQIQDIIKRQVFRTYRDVDDPQQAVRLYAPLFELLFSKLGSQHVPLVIFTTNYDPAIEAFWQQNRTDYELVDGFENDRASSSYVWRRKSFDELDLVHGRRNLVLFKLHGSADWMRTQGGIRKAPAVYSEDEMHGNVLIYPAKSKVAIEDPFFTAYDYLQKTLEGSRLLIVIGYSFRDYDALTKLKSAALTNPSLRVLIVDPDAKRLSNELRSKGIPTEAVEAHFGFGGGLTSVVTALGVKLVEFSVEAAR